MAVSVQANTPLAEQLSNVVQPKLVDIGWSTGGLDDSALAEYIILMLVNGKTQEQIASEISNDLLNLGPEDSGAAEFAKWLFEQVDTLNQQLNGGSLQGADVEVQQGESRSNGSAVATEQIPSISGDAEMSEAFGKPQDIPTGPKSMRNGGRPAGRRLVGQLNRAMDRSSNSILHRVRPQSGERVNQHNRPPPKGPRIGNINNRPMNNGIPTGPSKQPMQMRHQMPMMNPQQQMQLFNLMSQFMGSGPVGMVPGAPVPVVNPNFRGGPPNLPHQAGKSLFERVEPNPRSSNSGFQGHRPPHRDGQPHHKPEQDVEMGDDVSLSMEVEGSQKASSELSADTVCKFNLKCTKQDCPFAHQSPAAPQGTAIDVSDHCPFGAACQNRKCTARHPSPAQKKSHQSELDCKFFPNCTNAHCPFRHPSMPICRNGADCSRDGCKFTHIKTVCKYNPCLNPNCIYKHEEGQKRGKFGDKVWTAEGNMGEEKDAEEKAHVSERKFIIDDDGPEELIVPERADREGSHSSAVAEIMAS